MVRYFSISSFRNRIKALLKIKRSVYAGINDEIKNEFSGKSIDEIRQNRDMILTQDDLLVVKLRLPDKKQRLSKKDGYRLIYLVSKVKEVVVFLDIYPKNGPAQQLSIDNNELKRLLEEFNAEASADPVNSNPTEVPSDQTDSDQTDQDSGIGALKSFDIQ